MTQEIIDKIDNIRGWLRQVETWMAWMDSWSEEIFREDKFEGEPRSYQLTINANNGKCVMQREISRADVEKEFYLRQANLKKMKAELEKELEEL